MEGKMPRGLSTPFLADLSTGLLEPLLRRVKADPTLCLQLREIYLNVYYRGGNLLRLEASPRGYVPTFAEKYFKRSTQSMVGLPGVIRTAADLASWLEDCPLRKNAIDLFPKHSGEREVQQLLVAANNNWGVARATDYYICDIEYANPFGRFDFVAVHWPSSPSTRKQQGDTRLRLLGQPGNQYGDAESLEALHSVVSFLLILHADRLQLQVRKHVLASLLGLARNGGRKPEAALHLVVAFLLVAHAHGLKLVVGEIRCTSLGR